MKKIIILLVVFACWGCYDDDLVIVEDEQNSLHTASELTYLLRGVSSHNTTFDQFLDGSECFSIEFPYQVQLPDNSIVLIENEGDLHSLADENHLSFEFLYPLQIKTADYVQHQIDHKNQHLNLLEKCNNGEMFKDHIDCAELLFPIQLSVSDINHQRFSEVELNNAEELYHFLTDLSEDIRFKINYPIDLFTFVNHHSEVHHNQDLLSLILNASRENCKVIE